MEALHDVVSTGKARYTGAKITHLENAVGALSVKLADEEVAYLEEPYVPHPIVGHQ
jgi:aryl-alcohol dehydrogenase-like predicted oxidoreductase